MPPYNPQLKPLTRHNRNNPTDAENHLWQHIRMGQLDGHRFLRQRVIDNMIVDFICRGRKLIIEVDGGQHDQNRQADNLRTKRLNQHGYTVIRFWNNEVLTNIEGVLQTIQQALNASPPSQSVRGREQAERRERGMPKGGRTAPPINNQLGSVYIHAGG